MGPKNKSKDLADSGKERCVAFSRLKTPVGTIALAASELGLAMVHYEAQPDSEQLMKTMGLQVSRDVGTAMLEESVNQLTAYFEDGLTHFKLAMDLRGGTDFERSVWQETACIPFGAVLTYGEVAERIGNPLAFRAVGGALGRNPLLIVVPCHRVVAQGRSLGGFSSGLPLKRRLLGHEGYLLEKSLFEAEQ